MAADVVDDTAARRMFLMIDRDNSGTVDVEELIEVLSDEVLHSDDPITRMLVFHKGACAFRRDDAAQLRQFITTSLIVSAYDFAEIEEEMDHERDDLRQVFEKHAVEGHVVKDELIALCADLDRPLKNWEVEAAWRTMDPDEHGWVVRKPIRLQARAEWNTACSWFCVGADLLRSCLCVLLLVSLRRNSRNSQRGTLIQTGGCKQ